MSLNTNPLFPSAGCYVLKLHREAMPQLGVLSGRLEHIVSGDSVDFTSGEALLAWLLQHAAQVHEAPVSTDPLARNKT